MYSIYFSPPYFLINLLQNEEINTDAMELFKYKP